MFFNSKGKETQTFDAIVIGSGISGGLAAKELCEKGLKTLVLERGRNVKHVIDYPTANLDVWELPNRNQPTAESLIRQPKQARYSNRTRPGTRHFYVDDLDHPYEETKRFDWIRGYHVGGRSIIWGRQSYRWCELDFEANAKEGIGVDWPIRYKDIAPWYDYVERYAGISGRKEGLSQLPDGQFMPPMQMNCVEEHTRDKIKAAFPERLMTIGRVAHITAGPHNGRGKCQHRDRCSRGCPYGAYFSSNAATLPAAEATGNMTLRPHSIVHSIIYDKEKGKATGVRIIDAETKETKEFFAKIIFCNASAIASASILLQSKSDRFPNGMGNDSGELGHNIMDHHFRTGAEGRFEGFGDKYYQGKRPNGIYIARFRNINKATTMKNFVRGYGYQGSASRENWARDVKELGFGAEFKDARFAPGPWQMGINGFGEILPYHENKMTLNEDQRDQWGLPVVNFDVEIKDNEIQMRKDMANSAAEMLESAGFKNVEPYDKGYAPGLGIHEMGTARMGRDPKTSVLNGFNQIHAVPNVFVTDGACMTSASCVNPSLTYMALTARAVDHALQELKKLNI